MPILLRAGVLLLLDVVLQAVSGGGAATGANIGLGLLWFVLCLVVSGVWGHRDVRAGAPLKDVVILWSVVAVLVAVGVSLIARFFDGFALGPFLSDIVTTLPMVVFVVILPATMGGLLGERRTE